jgi:uroporphyrin-III C-methyltransferase
LKRKIMSIVIDKQTRESDTVPQSQAPSSHGRVYLVGAGPGDPDLITLKGLRCIRQADTVVYDRLISLSLLDEAPMQAERVFVGKEPRAEASSRPYMKQEEINALLIKHARQGRLVVRLKGGDPFIFGRGGEEALALARAGIPFEVVPGVSSAIAVPAYAGIPVTHRNYASAVTIVTGHEDATHTSSSVNWEMLARLDSTLVILMGVTTLPYITQRLLHGGLYPDTPAAVIQQGTVPQQRVITDTLVNIAEHAKMARIKSPAVVVIGAVVALSNPLAWFEETFSDVNQLVERFQE